MIGPILTNLGRTWRGLVICFGGGIILLWMTLRDILLGFDVLQFLFGHRPGFMISDDKKRHNVHRRA